MKKSMASFPDQSFAGTPMTVSMLLGKIREMLPRAHEPEIR